jgi:hypothetical protein
MADDMNSRRLTLSVPRTSSISCELDFDNWLRVRRASGTVTLSFLTGRSAVSSS